MQIAPEGGAICKIICVKRLVRVAGFIDSLTRPRSEAGFFIGERDGNFLLFGFLDSGRLSDREKSGALFGFCPIFQPDKVTLFAFCLFIRRLFVPFIHFCAEKCKKCVDKRPES